MTKREAIVELKKSLGRVSTLIKSYSKEDLVYAEMLKEIESLTYALAVLERVEVSVIEDALFHNLTDNYDGKSFNEASMIRKHVAKSIFTSLTGEVGK